MQDSSQDALARLERAERRFRLLCGLALALLVTGVLIFSHPTASAQNGNGLAQRVAALESRVSNLETALNNEIARAEGAEGALTNSLGTEIANRKQGDAATLRVADSYTDLETNRAKAVESALDARAGTLEKKTQFIFVAPDDTTGSTDTYFIGTNVHILNGLRATNGRPDNPGDVSGDGTIVNGLGNLIIGYNETPSRLGHGEASSTALRTGSHNLIVGAGHDYTSYGGIVVGYINQIYKPGACISGGTLNKAKGPFSSVSGGQHNQAEGMYAAISGGESNVADGSSSSISGGTSNYANGQFSSVSGGWANQATGESSSNSGGAHNRAAGANAAISGGDGNLAAGTASSVSGGAFNTAAGDESIINGGTFNSASGLLATIGGGRGLFAIHDYQWSAGSEGHNAYLDGLFSSP